MALAHVDELCEAYCLALALPAARLVHTAWLLGDADFEGEYAAASEGRDGTLVVARHRHTSRMWSEETP